MTKSLGLKKHIILLGLVFIYTNSVGQSQISFNPTKYSINPKIDLQIKKLSFIDTGTLKNSMTFKVTWDQDTVFNQRDPIDCYTRSYLSNDTIYITGYWPLGFGFQLAIFGDSCLVAASAISDADIYKFNKTDTTLFAAISLPTRVQKLILTSKPTFAEGGRVSGFVELESREFYYVVEKSEMRSSIRLKAYFKTAIIKKNE